MTFMTMHLPGRPRRPSTLFAAALTLVLFLLPATAALGAVAAEPDAPQLSRPGEYSGYSEPLYDEWVRQSLYVPMRDGVRLAVDVIRPARDGEPVAEPLPAVWTYNRYHRARLREGEVLSMADTRPGYATLVRHGYVLVSVDARGAGASYGVAWAPFNPDEARDGYDLTEWLAAQPWCDGNVGMVGGSYLGITQYMTAGTAPPHLEAIFPVMAGYDLYTVAHSGGVFRHDLLEQWSALVHRLDVELPAPPVDADPGAELRDEAVAAHAANRSALELFEDLPFRDSQDETITWPYYVLSPFTYAEGARRSGVAVYTLAGWLDVFGRDAFLWYAALEGAPQKMIIGPWSHSQSHGLDSGAELVRWFDYWLKGIDNGIMDEPPIHYRPLDAAADGPWRPLQGWPPPAAKARPFYFRAGPSGTVASANDGALAPQAPAAAARAADAYRVDYTATSGKPSRYSNGYGDGGRDFAYPDMAANDAKGLTYTSAPLAAEMEIAGHPVAHLWVSSTAADGDFFVYLEEVDAEGRSRYLSEGVLRASRRQLAPAPYPSPGLPFHRHMRVDAEPLTPGEPVELVLDLYPVANVFERGSRIRVTITCADGANHTTPVLDPPPTVHLYRDAAHPSRVVLPVMPPATGAGGP